MTVLLCTETFLDEVLHTSAVRSRSRKGVRLHVAGEVLEQGDLLSLSGSRWLNDKVRILRMTLHRV